MMGIALGVGFWIVTQVVAWGLAGAGHGWGGPLLFSVPLLVLYPVVLVRLASARIGGRRGDATVLGVAIVLDLALCYNIRVQEAGYPALMIDVAPSWVSAWIVLWVGWQVAAFVPVLRYGRHRANQDSVAR